MSRLKLHASALKEIDEAAAFYDQRAAGLGARFLRAIGAGLNAIERDPGRFAFFYEYCRRFLVRDFPYRIIYHDTPKEIRVLAIAHTRRSPLYWLKRK